MSVTLSVTQVRMTLSSLQNTLRESLWILSALVNRQWNKSINIDLSLSRPNQYCKSAGYGILFNFVEAGHEKVYS